MSTQHRKNDIGSAVVRSESMSFIKPRLQDAVPASAICGPLRDYLKFAFYCMLLAVPLYAISISIIRHDWVMVFIDALIVPVGFVHGLLLLFGFVN